MPKIKTNRSAAKRFKRTGSGKLKRSHAKRSHMFANKSQKQKRHLRKSEWFHIVTLNVLDNNLLK